MARIYYRLVVSGAWTVDAVPERWRAEVTQLLQADEGEE